MTDDPTPPIEKLVNAFLLSAIKKSAGYLRVAPAPAGGSVDFWLDGAWHEEAVLPIELYIPVVRRLGVMIGVLPPKKGQPWFGRLCLLLGEDRRQHFLVAIDRGDQLHALVELVDEVAYQSKRQPRPPSPHPYRHG